MTRHGRPSRWVYEHQSPHPIFHYPDILAAIETGQAADDLFGGAARRWRVLADDVVARQESVFIESAFFQIPIHPMRLMNWSNEEIGRYVTDVAASIRHASPLLVVLRHADVPRALDQTAMWRGDWFIDFLVRTIENSAYGRTHGATGLASVREYFLGCRTLIDRLTAQLDIESLVVDASVGAKPQVMKALARRLGLPEEIQFATDVSPGSFAGKYVAQQGDGTFDIIIDGADLYVNGDSPTRLIHRDERTFEIAGLPVTLTFVPDASGRITAINCAGPLPDLAPTWARATA